MTSRATPIAAVAVVVPVRDEQERLERCLQGIARALARLRSDIATEVVIVLDGCTDDSARIAACWPFTRIEVPSVGVGRARGAGAAAAFRRLSGVPSGHAWLASTDGDSEVPGHWLTRQLALADAGWDVVLGTVAPDLRDLPPRLHGTATARAATEGEPVYGANLGVRASRYHAVGGFPPLHEHEDARLVAALRADGARVMAAYDIPVLTSGRLTGRAPGGYAAYLRHEAAALPEAQGLRVAG